MKRIVLARKAEAQFADILGFTAETWGAMQAEAYEQRLTGRLKRLAAGELPRARSCAALFRNEPDESALSALTYYHEGSHYLILRETADTLEVAAILHEGMDLGSHIEELAARYGEAGRSDEEG